MAHHYLDAARQGKNDGWRYLVGILMIVSGALVLGSIAAMILSVIVVAINPNISSGGDFGSRLLKFLEGSSPWALTANLMPHFCGLAILIFVVMVVHQRSPLSLISPERKIDWGRVAWGFGVWWFLLMAVDIVNLIADHQSFQQSLQKVNWSAWLGFLPVALLTIPIQTSTEELFFRGYLVQGLGLLTRNSIVLYILGGLMFAVPHLPNPEMNRGGVWMALTYFIMGVFGVVLTLRDNRLELSLGEHAANNIYIVLISNSEDSVLKTPALMVSPPPDPQLSFWLLLGLMVLAYVLLFVWPRRARPKPMMLAEQIPKDQIQKDMDE